MQIPRALACARDDKQSGGGIRSCRGSAKCRSLAHWRALAMTSKAVVEQEAVVDLLNADPSRTGVRS